MFYKVEAIRHTGSVGEKDKIRTDKLHREKIGRILNLETYDLSTVNLGRRMLLTWLYDKNGIKLPHESMTLTSNVKRISVISRIDNIPEKVEVATENSVYVFKLCKLQDIIKTNKESNKKRI